MASDKIINVEVAYALPDVQKIIPLQVSEGIELIEAIKQENA